MKGTVRTLITLLLAAGIVATPAGAKDIVIYAGTLIDGVTPAPRERVSIVVRDDRIARVQDGFVSPEGAQVIDLSTSTVMPGFIDCHIHMSAKLPQRKNATEDWLTHSTLDRAFDAAEYLRTMLQQGFTSARDVGGGDETVAVRNAVGSGKIPGPRLWVSLEPLGPVDLVVIAHASWIDSSMPGPSQRRPSRPDAAKCNGTAPGMEPGPNLPSGEASVYSSVC